MKRKILSFWYQVSIPLYRPKNKIIILAFLFLIWLQLFEEIEKKSALLVFSSYIVYVTT